MKDFTGGQRHEDRYQEDPEFDKFCDTVIEVMEEAKAKAIDTLSK